MSVFFYAVPVLIIAGVLLVAVKVVRRSLELRSAWSSGLTAEGHCLRAYTTTSGGSGDSSVTTTQHHVYEFTTRDGRAVRFDEDNGRPTTVAGDVVTVHYTAAHPEKGTAHAPSPVKAAAATVAVLAFCGVLVAFCVGFMITYHEVFAGDSFFGGM